MSVRVERSVSFISRRITGMQVHCFYNRLLFEKEKIEVDVIVGLIRVKLSLLYLRATVPLEHQVLVPGYFKKLFMRNLFVLILIVQT